MLRRVYLLFAIFVAVYYATPPVLRSHWNKERLYKRLLTGERQERQEAVADLMTLNGQEQLLKALKSDSETARTLASNALLELWATAAGNEPWNLAQASAQAVEQREFVEALAILNQLTLKYPMYAEGWNRRATLHFQMGNFEKALADARKIVLLNPNHFAGWQLLGLSQMKQQDYAAAARSLRAALRLMPHDRNTLQMLRRCDQMQRQFKPGREKGAELV